MSYGKGVSRKEGLLVLGQEGEVEDYADHIPEEGEGDSDSLADMDGEELLRELVLRAQASGAGAPGE